MSHQLTIGILRERIASWRSWLDDIIAFELQDSSATTQAKKEGAEKVAKSMRKRLDQFEARWLTPPSPTKPQLRLVVDNGQRQESREEKNFEVPGGDAPPPGGGSAA